GGAPAGAGGRPGLRGRRAGRPGRPAGDGCSFRVRAGAPPGAGRDITAAALGDGPPEGGLLEGGPPEGGLLEGAVRWHADGSRIPAPPSLDNYGQRVAWAYPPPGRVRLAGPLMLLRPPAQAPAP